MSLWVENYRPKKIDDIVSHNELKQLLKNSIKSGNLPHLLFHGQPGTGKTSTIIACAKELFGRHYHKRVIELNASDEKGIETVRTKIINYAKSSLSVPELEPKFKIIILDESDALTIDAQSALRKVIEENSRTTRFCFICNYINQIISPIQSRCMVFKFNSLLDNEIFDRLKHISENENLTISDDCISEIVNISNGDLREAINYLQQSKYIYSLNKEITVNDIFKSSNNPSKELIEDINEYCIRGDYNLRDIENLTKYIYNESYCIKKIMYSLLNLITYNDNLSDKHKSLIIFKISNQIPNLFNSCNEYIQLLDILSFIYFIKKDNI